MIRDVLIPSLLARFPNSGLRLGNPPGPIAIFPPVHPEVGEIRIIDDGDEATIEIGDITHGHFNPYDASLPNNERDEIVSEMVTDFLEDLFADRVLLFKSLDGMSGGWSRRDHEAAASMPYGPDAESFTYVWSGPLPNPY